MRKVFIILIILLFVLLALLMCLYIQNTKNPAGQQTEASTTTPQRTVMPTASKPAATATKGITDPLKDKINSMTLDEKIGQLVIVGLDGYELNDNAASMLRDYKVGGFIVYGTNVKDSAQLLSLINTLKQANDGKAIPLFMSVDQEGGRIDRMPPEIKRFPTNKDIGLKDDGALSLKIGKTIAEEIKAFGFNLDFAPVLDINSNPNNPVIGDRSFGPTEEVVSKLGVQTMKGLQSGGVIPVVKHFPGHGDTSVDSHIGLPVVTHNLNRLRGFELLPFKSAIRNKADAVLIAHILLPEIDPDNPATFSKTIITGLLRNELGFGGVVITDDMTMGAIMQNYGISDAAVKSVNAGSDIILVAHDYAMQVKVIEALRQAAADGIISEQRINESVYRILKLKAKYRLADKAIGSVDVNAINGRIDNVLADFQK